MTQRTCRNVGNAEVEKKSTIASPKGATIYYLERETSKKDVNRSFAAYVEDVKGALGKLSKEELVAIHDCTKNCLQSLNRKRNDVKPHRHDDWAKGQSKNTIKSEISENCDRIKQFLD